MKSLKRLGFPLSFVFIKIDPVPTSGTLTPTDGGTTPLVAHLCRTSTGIRQERFTARVLKLTGTGALGIAGRPLADENHEDRTVSVVVLHVSTGR
jgi:hypothetical protein